MNSEKIFLSPLFLGIISVILIFAGGPFAGKGIDIIAYGILIGAFLIAIIGIIFGINELKLGKKKFTIIGIIICLIALLMSVYTGLVHFVMRSF